VVAHTCKINKQEAGAGGSQVQGQIGLWDKILSQKNKIKTKLRTTKFSNRKGPVLKVILRIK
jgi:hypothetical protein